MVLELRVVECEGDGEDKGRGQIVSRSASQRCELSTTRSNRSHIEQSNAYVKSCTNLERISLMPAMTAASSNFSDPVAGSRKSW